MGWGRGCRVGGGGGGGVDDCEDGGVDVGGGGGGVGEAEGVGAWGEAFGDGPVVGLVGVWDVV